MIIDEFFEKLCIQLKIGRISKKKRFLVEEKGLPDHLAYILLDFNTCLDTVNERRTQEKREVDPITPAEARFILIEVERLLNLRYSGALGERDHQDKLGPLHFAQVEKALDIWRPNFVYFCDNENLGLLPIHSYPRE